jgi:hypothetical protein
MGRLWTVIWSIKSKRSTTSNRSVRNSRIERSSRRERSSRSERKQAQKEKQEDNPLSVTQSSPKYPPTHPAYPLKWHLLGDTNGLCISIEWDSRDDKADTLGLGECHRRWRLNMA